MSNSGEPVVADRMFDEVRALHQAMTTPSQGPALLLEAIHNYQSFQINKVAATTSRLASACRGAGDSWNASQLSTMGLGRICIAGGRGEGACALPAAILRAEKIGHNGAVWALKIGSSIASAARGDLAGSQKRNPGCVGIWCRTRGWMELCRRAPGRPLRSLARQSGRSRRLVFPRAKVRGQVVLVRSVRSVSLRGLRREPGSTGGAGLGEATLEVTAVRPTESPWLLGRTGKVSNWLGSHG